MMLPTQPRRNKRYNDADIFNFIVVHKGAHDGNSPTLQEIMAATGIASKSTVVFHLNNLQAAGFITRWPRIEVVGGKWSFDTLRQAHALIDLLRA